VGFQRQRSGCFATHSWKGVKQVSRQTVLRSRGLLVALVSASACACSQPGGHGTGGSSATYSGADLAENLKQGAVEQG